MQAKISLSLENDCIFYLLKHLNADKILWQEFETKIPLQDKSTLLVLV